MKFDISLLIQRLKVFGEDEWKAENHGAEKRRLWRKLHLAVNVDTHQVISAELSLSTFTGGEFLPELLKKTGCERRLSASSLLWVINPSKYALTRLKHRQDGNH